MDDNAQLNEWLDVFGAAVASAEFVKLELRKPLSAAGDLKTVDVRMITVKRDLKLSFTFHNKTNDIVKNYSPTECRIRVAELFAKFASGRLYTLKSDLHLARQAAGLVMSKSPPSHKQLPELSHNRAKERLIESAGRPYLHALGLTDAEGHVHKNSQDKFRQINKYIEILDGLIKQLPPRERLRIVDMGAGKGYLTFALYDHLVNSMSLNADVTGVEVRENLVTLCNEIAAGSGFKNLRFEQGTIGKYDCGGADIVVALHACDTATDDAIAKAIRAEVSLIVVAPCCHKQIRREIDANPGDGSLAFLMRYGTYVERLSEMVTDGMRAQLMELSGYKCNLFEFIGDAHTPKNVMIVATRLANQRTAAERTRIADSIASTKAQFGIKVHQLERLLGLIKN